MLKFFFFWLFHALKGDSHLGDQIGHLEEAWGMDFLGVFFCLVDQLIYESFVLFLLDDFWLVVETFKTYTQVWDRVHLCFRHLGLRMHL